MKKLLSLAIAAAVAAPMAVSADTTMYGLIDVNVGPYDNGTADAWDVRDGNGTSRFGVKGSEDLGNGMKAIFQYEWDTNTSEGGSTSGNPTNRLGYVGLSGGFGTVAIGRQWTPYYGAVGKTNIMNSTGTVPHEFRKHLNTYRTGNAVAYISPNFNGFSFAAEAVMDGLAGEDGVDHLNVALKYDNGPLSVGLGYIDNEAADEDQWGLGAKYNFGNFAVVASYEDEDVAGVDEQAFGIGGEVYFGNNTVKVLYSDFDEADEDAWQIGLQHNFSKRTRAYVEYSEAEFGGADTDQFAIGLRHDF